MWAKIGQAIVMFLMGLIIIAAIILVVLIVWSAIAEKPFRKGNVNNSKPKVEKVKRDGHEHKKRVVVKEHIPDQRIYTKYFYKAADAYSGTSNAYPPKQTTARNEHEVKRAAERFIKYLPHKSRYLTYTAPVKNIEQTSWNNGYGTSNTTIQTTETTVVVVKKSALQSE